MENEEDEKPKVIESEEDDFNELRKEWENFLDEQERYFNDFF